MIMAARLDELRASCLDRSASPLWTLLDRDRFEWLMRPDHRVARRRCLQTLYHVLTLFGCEEAAAG